MTDILIGGLSRSMAAAIEAGLDGVSVHVVDTGGQVLEWLASHSCQLLILDHALPGVHAPEVVRRLTEGSASARIPVLYCHDRDADRNGARDGIERLGVREFLRHPFSTEILLERVVGIASSVRPAVVGSTASAPAPMSPPGDGTGPAGADDSEFETLGSVAARSLEALDRVAVSLLDGLVGRDTLRSARTEAAGLANVLAAFGRHQAAGIARDVDHLLDAGESGTGLDTLRLSELVVGLRNELDRPVAIAERVAPAGTRPLLVVLDSGSGFADNLALESQARGLRFRAVDGDDRLRELLWDDSPAVILIDLDAAADAPATLALIGEIEAAAPMTPVLVATSTADLCGRVEVARAGGYGLLRKPLSPANVVDAAIAALRRSQVAGCRVLAVDDDGAELGRLSRRLEPLGVTVLVLDDARRFLDQMDVVRPDVVLLGISTRHFSGLELCRVLRADERWIGVPIIILGDAADPAAMHLAALAGADDFVPRPLVARDLITRLANRLERHRVTLEFAGIDALTGAFTRQRVDSLLNSLMRLAHRYRKPFSMAAINIDGLREVNAISGDAAGDAVLRRLARMLQNSFRAEDAVGRWGGDQFVLGAFGLEKDDCVRRLRLIGARLGRDPLPGDSGPRITFSAGVASLFTDGSDMPSLYHAAEDALAHAKSLGRGWVLPSGWTAGQPAPTDVVDIVLIDADDALAGLLLHALEQAGWSTRRFRNAGEAMENLCGPWPGIRARVILLEVELPGRDGFAVLRALARDEVLGRSRVIMLTGRANEPEVMKAFDLGASDHVAKPFSMQVLLRRVRRAIRGA